MAQPIGRWEEVACLRFLPFILLAPREPGVLALQPTCTATTVEEGLASRETSLILRI